MTIDQAPDEHDLKAAEYAMGLLTGDELAEAKRLVSTDREFAQAVTEWEIRLAALTDDLALAPPPAAVKTALFARLFPKAERKPVWRMLWVWQAVSALSVVLLAVFFARDLGEQVPARGPLYSAEIVAEAGDFRVVAVVDKSTDEVFLTRTAGAAPEGRILQVWAHGEGEPAISVGLWPSGDTIRLPMPPQIAAVEGVLTLGVSEEPAGGSPTGSPSGRVFGTVDIPDVASNL